MIYTYASMCLMVNIQMLCMIVYGGTLANTKVK